VRKLPLLLVSAVVLFVSVAPGSAQILHRKKKVDKSTAASNTAEPDKLLYDKAMEDVKHGRHEVGRLGLQTLINTYPDSEYLAKAKLAIADSYFKEGGTANTTLAISGYKDFIVFFPFLPEAAYAQMQVAMANYNQMAKADRDDTHARAAEEEFQTFLTKYPKDPLAPQAQQRLREVQEVRAECQFRIAYYYYIKGDRRAAAGRLLPLVRRYPLYSKSDTALWMLGDVFEKSERKDFAGVYYAQILKNYPLSSHAPDAKAKLKAFGVPIPQADPNALAWMTAEQNTPRPKETIVHRSLSTLRSGPDMHMSARSGLPNMEPESETDSGTEILKGGGRATLVGGPVGTASGTPTGGSSGIVATVKPGEPAPAAATTEDVNSTTTPDSSSDPPAANSTAPAGNGSTDTSATPAATDNGTAQQAGAATNDSNKNQKESSSKKKGLKKLVPW
jgi:outer membrane protein assembly factor BamD